MNWTKRVRMERRRQIDLGYDEEENNRKSQAEWDHALQSWYVFMLQDVMGHDVMAFREHAMQFAAIAASWGATEQRFSDGTGWEWHDARSDGAISNPPDEALSDE